MSFLRSTSLFAAVVIAALVAGGQTVPSSLPAAGNQTTSAQTPATGTDFVQLMVAAQKSYGARQYDDAKAKFEEIRDRARAEKQELWEARAISGLGSVAYNKAQYTEARSQLLESLATFERLQALSDQARVQNLLASTAFYLGDYKEARLRYSASASLHKLVGDISGYVGATQNLIHLANFTPKEEDDLFQQLEREAKEAGDRTLQGAILHTWGDRYFTRNDFEPAIEKLQEAEALLKQTDARDELATLYNSLGRLYRVHGQPAAALRYQLRALEIHQSLNAPASIVQSLNSVAVTYDALGDQKRAREYYARAVAVADKTDSQRLQDFAHGNMAKMLLQDGDFARAAELLEPVVRRDVDTHTRLRHDQLAHAYLGLGRLKDALAEAQKAIESCGRSALDCVYAHFRMVDVELALGDEAHAMVDYDAAMQLIETAHSRLAASDFLKQGFHETFQPAYSLNIELNFRKRDYRKALEVSEQARSRAFLDLLASRNLEPKTEMYEAAISPVVHTTPQIANRDFDADLLIFTMRGAANGRSGASTAIPLEPSLKSTATAKPFDAKDLAATAKRLNSTLLQYWVSSNALYIWVVRQDGSVHGARVEIHSSELEKLVAATVPFQPSGEAAPQPGLTQMASRGGAVIALASPDSSPWRKLYNVLIRPVQKELPTTPGARLTIVPHGPLLGLSFAALLSPRGRYLLEDYTLHYVPAGAILKFTSALQRPDARRGQILLVADPAVPPALPGEAALPHLPGAREEARSIARLIPSSRVTLLMDDAAIETQVREQAVHKSVLHFATHAIVLDGDPFRSYLMLARAKDGSANGYLTAQEIYNLKLDADLVVLSACRSGGGRVTGDGIAALVRAFFYAGTPSIIASQWDVPDQPTNRLLPAVYRAWLGGSTKSAALRTAQLRLLRELRAGRIKIETPAGPVRLPEHPLFWASFVLFGEPD